MDKVATDNRIRYMREELGATLGEISDDPQVNLSRETVRKRLNKLTVDKKKHEIMKRVKLLNDGIDVVKDGKKGRTTEYIPADNPDYLKSMARKHRSVRQLSKEWDVSFELVRRLYSLHEINLSEYMRQMPDRSLEEYCEKFGIRQEV